MKTKPLTFILALTFLFLFSGSVYGGDFQDGLDAYQRKNYKEAFSLWKPLAEQGYALAQYNLGVMHDKGHGVPQDYKEAVKWYRLSVEQGNATAQNNLGLNYAQGQGVPQDYKEAIKWWKLAAEQGNAKAQYNLGVMYETGQEVTKDLKEAGKWFRLSAEQGYADSQYNLGVMYAQGKGVPQDYVLSYMWFKLAGSNGYRDGSKIIKNDIKWKMSFKQIEEAQQLARNWKPGDRIRTAESPPSSIPQPPKSSGAIATGTGFLFGSQDYIVTNYHVVKGTSEVTVKFTNGESINATVVGRDIQNDVAVLKLTKSPSFQSRAMKFGDSSMVRMGDEVFTIGYPSINIMGLKPKYTKGVISAVTGIKDNPTVFQTTVPIQPGNSGGPLFNDKGEVVGLTTSSLSLLAIESMGAVPQNVNYAVKSSFVKNTISTIPEALLSNRGIVVVPTDSSSRSDFIEAISKNVVLILGKVD